MKVILRPRKFRPPNNSVRNISTKGMFHGLGIDFLAVTARLYQLPCLWFSEKIFIELDFESQKLILRATEDKKEDCYDNKVIQEIPLNDFVCCPITALRNKYLDPFVANIAEYTFGMPKTARAIRERWHPQLILDLITEEGYPMSSTEIKNLLFLENW